MHCALTGEARVLDNCHDFGVNRLKCGILKCKKITDIYIAFSMGWGWGGGGGGLFVFIFIDRNIVNQTMTVC